MVIAFIGGFVLLVFVIDNQAINKQQMGEELQPITRCMTQQDVADYFDRHIESCNTDHEKYGYESLEQCVGELALFDPRMCR